jgi:O-antigen/teichoic acid export membrane protein
MFNNKYWLRSGFYSIVQRLSNVLFGFGSFALLVRFLSKEDFGIYVLFISVTSLIEVARIGLIQNALIKFLSSAKDDEYNDILSSSFMLNILITIVSVIILIVLAPILSKVWNSEKILSLFYIYCITAFVLIVFHQMNYLQQANLDFKGYFLSNFVRQGSFFVLVALEFFIIKPNPDLSRLAIYLTISAILGTVTTLSFGKKYLRISRRINLNWIKKLFNYGKYVFGTNISSMIFGSIDQFMLGSFLPVSSVAIFNSANRISNLTDVPISSVAAIIFPQSARRAAIEGEKSSGYLYERSVGVLIALLLPALIFIFIFAEQILVMVAGKAYSDAANILRVMTLTTFFQPFVRQFGTVMDSIGRPKKNFYLIMMISLLNITSNYFFINIFGTIGAAYGTLFTTFIFTVAALIIIRKLLEVRVYSTFVFAVAVYKDVYRQTKKLLRKFRFNPVA